MIINNLFLELLDLVLLLIFLLKAALESNLAQLYKNLIRLSESFKTVKTPTNNNEYINKSDSLPFHTNSLKSLIDDSAKMTTDCCKKLFDLSMLVPSAPWVKTIKL